MRDAFSRFWSFVVYSVLFTSSFVCDKVCEDFGGQLIQDFFLLLLVKRTTRKSFNDDDVMMITKMISLQRVRCYYF